MKTCMFLAVVFIVAFGLAGCGSGNSQYKELSPVDSLNFDISDVAQIAFPTNPVQVGDSIYFQDGAANLICCLNYNDLEYIDQFSIDGHGPGECIAAVDLSYDGKNLIVCDYQGCKISYYSLSGEFEKKIEFENPLTAEYYKGKLYVASLPGMPGFGIYRFNGNEFEEFYKPHDWLAENNIQSDHILYRWYKYSLFNNSIYISFLFTGNILQIDLDGNVINDDFEIPDLPKKYLKNYGKVFKYKNGFLQAVELTDNEEFVSLYLYYYENQSIVKSWKLDTGGRLSKIIHEMVVKDDYVIFPVSDEAVFLKYRLI